LPLIDFNDNHTVLQSNVEQTQKHTHDDKMSQTMSFKTFNNKQ